jgi:hypothetical protein
MPNADDFDRILGDTITSKVFTDDKVANAGRDIVTRRSGEGCKLNKSHRLSSASTRRIAAFGFRAAT